MEKVQILLSVYKPNPIYLEKQLKSLDSQTYENLEILVFDDASSISPVDQSIFEKYLKRVKYSFIPNESKNVGYIKAFELLTKHSDAKYIAFCDQDDIWFDDKIEKSVETLKKDKSLLVASERQIIDGEDHIVKELARQGSNKNYDNWHSFDDITQQTAIITFAVGMSIVVDGDFLRSILPFSQYTGHDNWALICASIEGTVSFIEQPLVQYRRHGNNVSGVLIGIESKDDYIKQRVIPNQRLLAEIKQKYPNYSGMKELEDFVNARYTHNIFKLIKYYHFAPDVAKFDIVFSLVPGFMFKTFLNMVRKL